MSQTAERLSALRWTLPSSLDELKGDAKSYLEQLEKLETLPPESDEYEDALANLHVTIVTLMTHATSTNDLLHDIDEASADDE